MNNKILPISVMLGLLLVGGFAIAAVQNRTVALHTKDPTTWATIGSGEGTLTYGHFDFYATNVPSARYTSYTLIRYTDPWPGKVVCLGTGKTEGYGSRQQVRISGLMLDGGPKVWLVLSSDVDCNAGKMIAWNPSKYLFEMNLI